MNWRAVMAGVAAAGIVAGIEGVAPMAADAQAAGGQPAWVSMAGAAVPEAAPGVVLPPHLIGNLPRPLPGGAGVALPTLQDLMQISPAYAAPPPARQPKRQKAVRDQ